MTGRSIAFLVGIDEFGDVAFPPLRFCQNDVAGMQRVLGNEEIGGFEVIAIANKPHYEILRTLEKIVSTLVPGDKLLFYFAGHGCRSPQSGALYLVASNTEADLPRSTGVPIEHALAIIRESRCTNRALILDCCHSGAVGGSAAVDGAFRGSDVASGLTNLARDSGTYILTASTAIQRAEEREVSTSDGMSGNGIFTRYFIEALESGNVRSGDNDIITIDSVYDYVLQHVLAQSQQTPQRFVIGGAGTFVVGRSSGAAWERRRTEFRKRVLDLHEQNLISDTEYVQVASLVSVAKRPD